MLEAQIGVLPCAQYDPTPRLLLLFIQSFIYSFFEQTFTAPAGAHGCGFLSEHDRRGPCPVAPLPTLVMWTGCSLESERLTGSRNHSLY